MFGHFFLVYSFGQKNLVICLLKDLSYIKLDTIQNFELIESILYSLS